MYNEHFLSARVRASIMTLMYMSDPVFRNGISCRKLSSLVGLKPQFMRDILIELRENGFIDYGKYSRGAFTINDDLSDRTLDQLIRVIDQGIHVGNNTSKDPSLIKGTAYNHLLKKEAVLRHALEGFMGTVSLREMIVYGSPFENMDVQMSYNPEADPKNRTYPMRCIFKPESPELIF